ncbi:hypothetical protein UFOVP672_6 [uncultured Caudovirales phage]|uniref:Uncharacterized protein n=1 Tax=uncultured Caudovirales phage TaxID=2100421 RepID=A0A6J5N8G2_9CAUD|nr:hypothetical protein UFOVP672_6 [uncultured Caudovirales phage]
MKFPHALILVLFLAFLYLAFCPVLILPDGDAAPEPAERVQEPFNDDLCMSSIHKLQLK